MLLGMRLTILGQTIDKGTQHTIQIHYYANLICAEKVKKCERGCTHYFSSATMAVANDRPSLVRPLFNDNNADVWPST